VKYFPQTRKLYISVRYVWRVCRWLNAFDTAVVSVKWSRVHKVQYGCVAACVGSAVYIASAAAVLCARLSKTGPPVCSRMITDAAVWGPAGGVGDAVYRALWGRSDIVNRRKYCRNLPSGDRSETIVSYLQCPLQ